MQAKQSHKISKTKQSRFLMRARLTPFSIDPQQQVKMWFSKDGLPEKHQARFVKFLTLNPNATLKLIYSDKYLTSKGRKNIRDFAEKTGIILIDYDTIKPANKTEIAIKKWIDRELEYYFNMHDSSLKGNLSVVSDQLHFLEAVLELGISSDCDVEFNASVPTNKINAKFGFIAKMRNGVDGYEGGERVSNDLIGGDPNNLVFKVARMLTLENNARYHAALPAYFKRNNIDFDPNNYENHPRYFEARNKQLKMFSLGGGPQLFAIAVYLCGITTGYENSENAEVFVYDENFTFKPYIFDQCEPAYIKRDFSLMLPLGLRNSLVASWDHSWEEGNYSWKVLNTKERVLLQHFNQLHSHVNSTTYVGFSQDLSQLVHHLSTPAVPRVHVSILRSYLTSFLHFNLPGRRHREFHELRKDEQRYILKNETPNEDIRNSLIETLGPEFKKHAASFSENGFIILPAFFKDEQLHSLKEAYEKEINKKKAHPFLKQISFNAAVDEMDQKNFETVFTASTNEHLQALIRFHFGQEQCVAAMRGYRQLKTSEVSYRAWDYHQDLKTKGPTGEIKMMVLLNEVKPEGQAMRIIPGSHKFHWYTQTQQDTKYTLDEALGYSNNTCATICYGPPGTVILFDTNILHSGHRNEHSERDIYTISYVPMTEDAPVMSPKFAERKDVTAKQKFTRNTSFWQSLNVRDESLTKEQTTKLQKEYKRIPNIEQLKERFKQESSMTFAEFIVTAISTDVNGDLDLQLRMGKLDTTRDNQLVAFRDVPLNHDQYQRLAASINKQDISINYDLDIEKIRGYAQFAMSFRTSEVHEVSRSATLILDLEEAFSRVDTVQRLRTTLAYLYFALDRMLKVMEEKQFDPDACTKMREYSKNTLGSYISLVFLDDLAYNLCSPSISVGMK